MKRNITETSRTLTLPDGTILVPGNQSHRHERLEWFQINAGDLTYGWYPNPIPPTVSKRFRDTFPGDTFKYKKDTYTVGVADFNGTLKLNIPEPELSLTLVSETKAFYAEPSSFQEEEIKVVAAFFTINGKKCFIASIPVMHEGEEVGSGLEPFQIVDQETILQSSKEVPLEIFSIQEGEESCLGRDKIRRIPVSDLALTEGQQVFLNITKQGYLLCKDIPALSRNELPYDQARAYQAARRKGDKEACLKVIDTVIQDYEKSLAQFRKFRKTLV